MHFRKDVKVIDIIRCIACLMIFFYHCNTILPGEFRWLTFFGEDMGNQLFFMISGFALFPSIQETAPKGLPRWYFKRLARILPMLGFFYLLSYLTGFYSLNDPAQVFTVFVYPTLYWFVTAILVFYLALFLFLKIDNRYVQGLILLALFAAWCIRADKMEAYYFAGALSMFTGALLRKTSELETERAEGRKWLVPALFIVFLAYVFVKYFKYSGLAMAKFPQYYGVVSVAAGVLAIFAGIVSLRFGYLKNDGLTAFFAGKERFYGIIGFIGRLAFPLYMVQCFNAGIIGYTIGNRVPFPASFAVNLIIVWGIAIISHFVFEWIGKHISRICHLT